MLDLDAIFGPPPAPPLASPTSAESLAHEVERVEAVEPIVTAEKTHVATVENVPEFTPETTPVDLAAAWALMVEELANDPTFPAVAVEALRVAHVEWAASGP